MKTFLKQSTEARRELILTANPIKTLLILSLPSLLMNTVQAMMPFTDGLFINNLTGYAVTGAVTFSQPIISMVLGLSQGLSVAAMAIIGQLNGRGAIEEGKRVAAQIFLFAVMLGIISAPLLLIISVAVSRSLQSDIAPYVRQYIAWYSIVLPFSFLESVYNGIKNANGKPEAAFTRMTILFIMKVVGNFLFLYVLRLEILGCVLASLLANATITVWMVYELFIHKSPDKLDVKNFKFDSKIIREVLKVGFPAMFNYSFLYLGFFLINKEIERYGAIVVAAQGIASNINALCFNLPAAFSAAITTMVSMHIGAGYPQKAKRDCLLGCITSIIIAVIMISIMIPLSPYLTVLFRREPEIIGIANNALNIYTYSIIGFGICMTIQGAFIGLGKTKMPLVLGVLRIWLLRYIFVLATEHVLQYYAIFWGNLFSNMTTALIATVLILRTKWVSALTITTERKGVTAMHGSLAQIPQVEKLLSHHELSGCIEKLGRPIVASIVSEYIKQIRAEALKGSAVPSFDTCIADIRQRCTHHIRKRISKIINATGIILHTNLGRSPLPHGIWDAAKEAAQSYSAIEMDLEDGKRGPRFPFAVEAMSTLVRAEAALMLNNNAAAVFLLLKALASGKEVIVARGQQVQIGGGFRIPDILREAGCTLVEVGTTNITTLEDITAAVTEQTAMLLWVHTSNYKIRGFTEQPSLSAIRQALPPEIILAVDQGSGVISLSLQDEPTVPALLKEGADLVCFSGDKVFGGPQCGWITGKKDLIALIARHPLMRTYRVGRAVAALMEETLVHYLNNGKSAAAEALLLDPAVIKKRSEKLVRKLPSGTACVVPYPFSLGGGSTPDEAFPSWAIMLHTHKPETVKTALRFCSIPIIAIISEDRLLLHLAAVNPADDIYIIKELQEISKNSPGF